MNYCGPISIFAYGDTIMIFASVQQALNSTGIGLNHVAVGKEAAIRTEGNVMKAAERHSLVSIIMVVMPVLQLLPKVRMIQPWKPLSRRKQSAQPSHLHPVVLP
ncbi:hypothetical protein P3S67_022699 [Capsicum chacoense]